MSDSTSHDDDDDLFFAVSRHEPPHVDVDPASDLFEVVTSDHLDSVARWTAADEGIVNGAPAVSAPRLTAGQRPSLLISSVVVVVTGLAVAGWWYWRPLRAAGVQPEKSSATAAPGTSPRRATTSSPSAANVTKPSTPQAVNVATASPAAKSLPTSFPAPRPSSSAPTALAPRGPAATPLAADALPSEAPAMPSIASRWARVTSPADAALALSRLSTQSAASPKVSDEQAVRLVIERYRLAYVAGDASAARAVWPNADANTLARTFDGSTSEVDFSECEVRVSGDVASAGCTSNSRSPEPSATAAPRVESRIWNFDLSRAGRNWQIDKVESR
jgi:hypothetical protein